MTDLRTREPPKLAPRPRRLRRPPFAIWFPLAAYALIRLIDVGFILAAQRHQVALPDLGKPAHPGYFAVLIMIGIASEWLWIDRFLVISTTAKVGMFP